MRLKKLLIFGLATVMLMSMSITAFAATSLSADEQNIINTLTTAGVPTQYVTQARNYLAGNATDVTAAQATAINAQITAAKTIAGSATSLTTLTVDQQNAISADLVAAGKEIGVVVTFDAAANSIKAVDASGATILDASLTSTATPAAATTDTTADSTTEVIKTTGVNMNTTIEIIAVLALALVACGVVVSKKRFAENV